MAEPELSPPRALVAGKYRLTALLGRGGMGSVWEGQHTTLGTRVAVKFIDAEYAESPEARNRFENEARAAARLRSKHVVEVYDHGVSEDGRPFIVMEFLQGEPLDKRLDRLGRLHAKEVARIVLQVCRALTKAHAAGIVHRDLKPENVFLVWDDEDGSDIAKVVDFGIAKFTDSSLGASSSTRTGSVLGTPYYMSPEQARGLRSVDQRSDLWSIAVIAFRAIVGRLPFEGEAVGDLLVKLCTSPIPVPSELAPDVPPGFDAWIAKGMCREPEGRFRNAMELAESLCAVCGLSTRGSYATGDMPQMSMGSLPMPAILPITAGSQAATVAAAATGAPTTQTPTPGPSPRPQRSAIVAATLAALVVLAIGGGVAFKKLNAKPPVDPGAASLGTVTPAPAPELPKPAEPSTAEGAPTVASPAVVPKTDTGSAPTDPASATDASASASAKAALAAKAPAATPAPPVAPVAPKWVAPAHVAPPKPTAALTSKPPKKEIDIGY